MTGGKMAMHNTRFFAGLTWKLMIAPAVIIVLLMFYGAFASHNLSAMETRIAELNDSVNMERLAQEAEAGAEAPIHLAAAERAQVAAGPAMGFRRQSSQALRRWFLGMAA